MAFERVARTPTVEALLAGMAPGAVTDTRRLLFSKTTWIAALLVVGAAVLIYIAARSSR